MKTGKPKKGKKNAKKGSKGKGKDSWTLEGGMNFNNEEKIVKKGIFRKTQQRDDAFRRGMLKVKARQKIENIKKFENVISVKFKE